MKRFLVILLAFCLLMGQLPAAALAADVAAGGKCGDDLTWELTTDGTLTISGQGEMYNFDFLPGSGIWNSPWYSHREDIRKIIVEPGVTSIGQEAFHYYYRNVTKVSLPDTLETIEDSAFYHCTALPEIRIPESVTRIGQMAFAHCESLTAIRIPENVEYLDDNAFYSCDSLVSISLSGSLGVLSPSVFMDCNALKSVTVPEGISYLGYCAFASCDLLEQVNLPDSLEFIGEYAFSYCKNLQTITIPENVSFIDGYAFDHCSKLTQVVFCGDAPEMKEAVFNRISATVYYPADNATWTEDVMGDYGGVITWVPYWETVTVASGWSGNTRWSLRYDGVLTISGSGNMKNYDWDGGQPWAVYRDLITSVVIEEGVTAVGSGAFMNMTALKNVTLPEKGLRTIGEAAFYGCTALKQIDIPDGVYTVWAYTFKNCTALEEVRLPRTLEKIDQGAFENCTALPYILIPTETEIIGCWSFKGCTGLLEADMSWADATEIREGAFKNCACLTWIHLPEDIQTLGDSCFYGTGARSFAVPSSVRRVGAWCFARSSLQNITFRGAAPAIGEGAFNRIAVTAYYPAEEPGWTPDVMQSYGGTVTWVAQ